MKGSRVQISDSARKRRQGKVPPLFVYRPQQGWRKRAATKPRATPTAAGSKKKRAQHRLSPEARKTKGGAQCLRNQENGLSINRPRFSQQIETPTSGISPCNMESPQSATASPELHPESCFFSFQNRIFVEILCPADRMSPQSIT